MTARAADFAFEDTEVYEEASGSENLDGWTRMSLGESDLQCQEMDSPSFPGVRTAVIVLCVWFFRDFILLTPDALRTVYRKEIMEGHLKETDEASLNH